MSNAAGGSDADAIEQAAQRLANGEVVAFPTETVYGLGADAENVEAVAKIYALKGRPPDHPVIVHVAPEVDLAYWCTDIPDAARQLTAAFWPGPLTLILKRASHIPDAVSGGQASIGLRCPSHPLAQQLLRRFAALKANRQAGVAAPSANQFGRVSPTLAEHVRAEFADAVAQGLCVIEGGASTVGIESTIVDLSRMGEGVGPVLLRHGHITATQIAQMMGVMPEAADAAAPRASGTLRAHYAPHTPVTLIDEMQLAQLAAGYALPLAGGRVVVLSYSPQRPTASHPQTVWRPMPPEPQAYAQIVYAVLRELDQQGFARILIQRPPADDAWAALTDRLSRAAAAFQD